MQFIINHLRRLWLAHLAVVLYAVSLALPSVRFFNSYLAGYQVALGAEQIVYEISKAQLEYMLRTGPSVLPQLQSMNISDWPILIGASANHAFFLSYIAVNFFRPLVAMLLAGIAVLCAAGCLLPSQIANVHNRWDLGPGYFLWCGAAGVLLVATIGQWRRIRAGSTVPRDPPCPPLQRGGVTVCTGRKLAWQALSATRIIDN